MVKYDSSNCSTLESNLYEKKVINLFDQAAINVMIQFQSSFTTRSIRLKRPHLSKFMQIRVLVIPHNVVRVTSPPNGAFAMRNSNLSSIAYLLPPTSSTITTTPHPPASILTSVNDLQKHKQELIQLARVFIDDGNTDQYIHQSCFAPEFHTIQDSGRPMSLPEFIEFHSSIKVAFPNYHIEPLSESVDMNLWERKASVWMWVRATGVPEGVVREGLALWKFRLSMNSNWLCCYHSAFSSCNELVTSALAR